MAEEIDKTDERSTKVEKVFRFLSAKGEGLEFGRDENQQDMMVFRFVQDYKTTEIIKLSQEEFEQLYNILDEHFIND